MSYDHIQQLRNHAVHTAQQADHLTGVWLNTHDYADGQAAHGALAIADQAAQELRRAVHTAVTGSVN